MDRNKIRHKILGILVENYRQIEQKFGEYAGFIAPMYEEYLLVPVSTITKQLKISYEDFEKVATKASKDKTIKFDENAEGECVTLGENTFLFYNEEIYLNQKDKWKDKHPFLYDIILILVTAFISVVTTLAVAKLQYTKEQEEQVQINNRQDSPINKLTNSIKVIQDSKTPK